jgi:hypothetical protein
MVLEYVGDSCIWRQSGQKPVRVGSPRHGAPLTRFARFATTLMKRLPNKCALKQCLILMGSLDQRLVHSGRQFAGRKFGKRSRERRLARHLSRALPAAQSTRALVHPKVLDQHRSCRQFHHHFGHERACQRRAVNREDRANGARTHQCEPTPAHCSVACASR